MKTLADLPQDLGEYFRLAYTRWRLKTASDRSPLERSNVWEDTHQPPSLAYRVPELIATMVGLVLLAAEQAGVAEELRS